MVLMPSEVMQSHVPYECERRLAKSNEGQRRRFSPRALNIQGLGRYLSPSKVLTVPSAVTNISVGKPFTCREGEHTLLLPQWMLPYQKRALCRTEDQRQEILHQQHRRGMDLTLSHLSERSN